MSQTPKKSQKLPKALKNSAASKMLVFFILSVRTSLKIKKKDAGGAYSPSLMISSSKNSRCQKICWKQCLFNNKQ